MPVGPSETRSSLQRVELIRFSPHIAGAHDPGRASLIRSQTVDSPRTKSYGRDWSNSTRCQALIYEVFLAIITAEVAAAQFGNGSRDHNNSSPMRTGRCHQASNAAVRFDQLFGYHSVQ